MSVQISQSLRDLAAQLRAALAAAQEQRDKHPNFVVIDGVSEPEWVVYERFVMHRETNSVRTDVGLPEVPMEAIVRVEQHAAGHVDYTQKFAFYCAELALDCPPIWKPREATAVSDRLRS